MAVWPDRKQSGTRVARTGFARVLFAVGARGHLLRRGEEQCVDEGDEVQARFDVDGKGVENVEVGEYGFEEGDAAGAEESQSRLWLRSRSPVPPRNCPVW